jgi:hypothetical protein
MPLNTSGRIGLLRVHDRGTAYGPATDRIDVEVVMQFAGRPADAFGFQLRDDANGPARQGMLDLLRDAFNHGWIANIDYEVPAGRHNGTIIRTWLTKPPGSTATGSGTAATGAAVARRSRVSTKSQARKSKGRGA